eukprot:6915660-Alexandrium_andersonii.AAC.1
MSASLVGSEMCIRDSTGAAPSQCTTQGMPSGRIHTRIARCVDACIGTAIKRSAMPGVAQVVKSRAMHGGSDLLAVPMVTHSNESACERWLNHVSSTVALHNAQQAKGTGKHMKAQPTPSPSAR